MIENAISTNENLVQDISNELIFGHTHNGVKCAVCPTAKRACDRAWFSAKQIEEWSEMSTMTLNRRLRDLEECQRIQSLSDLVKIKIEDNNGRGHETTLYNLNVLNQLAMVEMKNKVLNETSKKFSDILSEVETTGRFGMTQISRKDQLFLDTIHAESEHGLKEKEAMDSTSSRLKWSFQSGSGMTKNPLHNRSNTMQNTMLDSTISCTPSTLNFICDVDGVHTEIPIPSSAWDVENETVWLTQAQLAELYKTSVPNICLHIGNILEDEELQADSTIKESLIVQLEGNREVSREVKHYNLEMLIALGYRIKSKVATKFRQWATKHLKELMTKGRTEIETQPQHPFTIPKTFPEALRAYADEVERREAAEKRAITAEAELSYEKEAHEKDNEDFRNGLDILNAQKAQIGSKREATAMATASSAKAHQHFAEKVLETHASELIALRAAVEERRSHLWDANRTAQAISKLRVLEKEYSLNTLQNKARELLSHFATKLGKPSIPLPNGSTYTDPFGRLQTSVSTYYERDVADAVLDWVVENPSDFARIGGKRDPLQDEW